MQNEQIENRRSVAKCHCRIKIDPAFVLVFENVNDSGRLRARICRSQSVMIHVLHFLSPFYLSLSFYSVPSFYCVYLFILHSSVFFDPVVDAVVSSAFVSS